MADEQKNPNPSTYVGTVKVNIRGRDYYVHISPPPMAMSLPELTDGLERNRAILKECQDKMRDTFVREAFEYAPPWQLNYDTPTQDAIMAHININLLVPLINLKGGEANFEKAETFPVTQRVEIMRNVAEKSVFVDRMQQYNHVHTAIMFTIILAVLLSLVLV